MLMDLLLLRGPQVRQFSVSAAPLPNAAMVCHNNLVISNPSASGTPPQSVPVTLNVSNNALLNASPQSLTFTAPIGQSTLVPSQTVGFSSTDPATPLTINVSSSAPWVTPIFTSSNTQQATTPANLTVNIAPYIYASTSAVGTYTAMIMVSATGPTGQPLPPVNIQVTLTVTSGLTLVANPTSLTFTQAATAAAPANQTITLSVSGPNSGTLPFSAAAATDSGGSWLAVTPATGASAPSVITVSITPTGGTLNPGTYTGSIILTAVSSANPGGTLKIPVTLTITAPPTLVATPIGVTLTGTVSGANPTAQLAITAAAGGGPTQFTATATSGTGSDTSVKWLSVSPGSGTTPANLTVSANLAGLPARYIQRNHHSCSCREFWVLAPHLVPVTLTVGAQPAPMVTSASSMRPAGVWVRWLRVNLSLAVRSWNRSVYLRRISHSARTEM